LSYPLLSVPDEKIPYLLALLMGLQHCFAMVGGLITPPLVIFRFTVCDFPGCPDLETYAVSAALIASGICSIINITKFKIPFAEKIFKRDMYYGSGILSVMGTRYADGKRKLVWTAYSNLLGVVILTAQWVY
jgi:NCS2 family nucleobase:cation symporter-2